MPILQGLMDKPQELYALVLSPTRELAIQIAEQFEALGAGIGLKTAVLVGGIDMMAQVWWFWGGCEGGVLAPATAAVAAAAVAGSRGILRYQVQVQG